jgi:hypothetical protein
VSASSARDFATIRINGDLDAGLTHIIELAEVEDVDGKLGAHADGRRQDAVCDTIHAV